MIINCLVAFVIISLSYYFLVVRVVDKEMKRFKDWQKATGMEEVVKKHQEEKKKNSKQLKPKWRKLLS